MILLGVFVVMLSICSIRQTDATSMDSPGLNFVPRPDPADENDTLIHYKASDEASVRKWTSKIDDFLKQYNWKATGAENRMACSWDYPTTGNMPCDVPLQDFHRCESGNSYNYPSAGPCVFLTLDKLLDWTPDPYNTTQDLPTDMPESLQRHISIFSGSRGANAVWVTCEGESPADVEAMGPIVYIPRLGLPSFYFPYSNANQEGYLSPLAAVLFEKPQKGVVINIECRAWAKNISRDGQRGSVHLKLMVDP